LATIAAPSLHRGKGGGKEDGEKEEGREGGREGRRERGREGEREGGNAFLCSRYIGTTIHIPASVINEGDADSLVQYDLGEGGHIECP